MTETNLSYIDKKRISDDIKLFSLLALLLSGAVILIIMITAIIMWFFFNPTEGFWNRVFIGIGVVLLILVTLFWNNILKYLDLKRGKKFSLITSDYKILKDKEGFVLKLKKPINVNFQLNNSIPKLIRSNEALIIESTRFSKTLLFISHNEKNLIEQEEQEDSV